jgi:trans-2,3-dihydro-3-hydroxyanthranilate isomerase
MLSRPNERRGNPIDVVHTVVFAAGSGGGNPSPVIADADRLADNEMEELGPQVRAGHRFHLSSFIFRPQAVGADVRIRYFVPDREMGVPDHRITCVFSCF